MKEFYGIVGAGSAPKKVIDAALNDIGTQSLFIIPWYGSISKGLEVVYDWVLDNDVSFSIAALEGVKKVPKSLAEKAGDIVNVDDVNDYILWDLKGKEVPGMSLVLWDEEDETSSTRLAAMSIGMQLATLELTNGLVPIMLDDSPDVQVVVSDELPDIDEASYDRETLEIMPTALVKRMAKDKGFEPKSKEEAVEMLSPTKEDEKVIGSIIFLMNDGSEIGFNGTEAVLKEMFKVVAKHSVQW